jgi:glucan endo-1,3-alpha-glucosidase
MNFKAYALPGVFVFSSLATILLALLLSITDHARAQTTNPHYVVAHYHTAQMFYQAGESDTARYQNDIRAAMEMGLDGFAVNTFWGSQSNGQFQGLANAADAIGAANFKMFLSADMGLGYTAADIVSVMKKWDSNPHYLKVNGKPVLSTYSGGSLGNAWWQDNVIGPLAAAGHPVTFIPYFDRPNPNGDTPSYANWTNVLNTFPVVNGLFNFLIPGSVPFYKGDPHLGHHWWSTLEGAEALAQAVHDQGKVFMAPYLPYYWAVCHSARQYMEYQSGRGTGNEWTSIITKQNPELVELVTWNDYTESTFVQPTRMVPNDSNIPAYPHLGFYELNKYYINWYKIGVQPAITKDAVFYFYRTQPVGVAATNDSAYCGITNPRDSGQLWGNIQDNIFVTTALTQPAEIHVITGGTTRISPVAAGVVTTDVPFTTGSQSIELWRGGVKLGSQQGTNIDAAPAAYNYNVYSNYFVIGGANGNTWFPSDKWQAGFVAEWFVTESRLNPPSNLRQIGGTQ